MNRTDLQKLSRQRRREANILLKAGHWSGAYYLLGYAVECALKACIAKQTQKDDFPDKGFAQQVFTHNLEELLKAAGLNFELKNTFKTSPTLAARWTVVKDWNETKRYELAITRNDAKALYSACTARHGGILSWIRKRW